MSKIDFSVSRRDLLAGASAAGALAISSFDRAFGKAPMLNTPAPSFYRFKIGNVEATIATDGALPLGDPHKNYIGLSPGGDGQAAVREFPADRQHRPRAERC